MSDKQYYLAYLLEPDNTPFSQLLRVAFEYEVLEYWAEPEEQKILRDYFEKNHYTKQRPVWIEKLDILDFMLAPTDNKSKEK